MFKVLSAPLKTIFKYGSCRGSKAAATAAAAAVPGAFLGGPAGMFLGFSEKALTDSIVGSNSYIGGALERGPARLKAVSDKLKLYSIVEVSRSWDGKSREYIWGCKLQLFARLNGEVSLGNNKLTLVYENGLDIEYNGLDSVLNMLQETIQPPNVTEAATKNPAAEKVTDALNITNDRPDVNEDVGCRSCMFLVWSLRQDWTQVRARFDSNELCTQNRCACALSPSKPKLKYPFCCLSSAPSLRRPACGFERRLPRRCCAQPAPVCARAAHLLTAGRLRRLVYGAAQSTKTMGAR